MSAFLRMAAATLAFAALHSALASRTSKRWSVRAAGERNVRVWYRPLFVTQGLATSAALAAFGLRLPKQSVYRATGPIALALRGVQVFAVVQLLAGIRSVGLRRLVGYDSLQAWRAGGDVPEAPVAQGPERDARRGTLTAAGPFRYSRHPLNFWAVPLFWCTPHLTTRRLAFNLLSTAYLALGSAHEESRLRAAYGHDYLRYAASGPAFFVPRMRRLAPGGNVR
jgi:methanethiol S-methyltransferase